MLAREMSLAQRQRLRDSVLPHFTTRNCVEGRDLDGEIEAGLEEGINGGELFAGEEDKAMVGREVVDNY